eukprot:scaffold163504_cov14-Prasinocladus_malaysianus.AAC.1
MTKLSSQYWSSITRVGFVSVNRHAPDGPLAPHSHPEHRSLIRGPVYDGNYFLRTQGKSDLHPSARKRDVTFVRGSLECKKNT